MSIVDDFDSIRKYKETINGKPQVIDDTYVMKVAKIYYDKCAADIYKTNNIITLSFEEAMKMEKWRKQYVEWAEWFIKHGFHL